MITAEEFIRQYIRDIGGRDYTHEIIDVEDAIEALKEFAKEAIKEDRVNIAKYAEIKNKSQYHECSNDEHTIYHENGDLHTFSIDENSIINAPNIELL